MFGRRRRSSKERVFVSYVREHENLVTPLVKVLQIGDRPVFQDLHIKPGMKWESEICKALDQATLVVVIWCKHAAVSQWVTQECDSALRAGKKIIPVNLDQTPLRDGLSAFQSIDFTGFFDHEQAEANREPIAEGNREHINDREFTVCNIRPRWSSFASTLAALLLAMIVPLWLLTFDFSRPIANQHSSASVDKPPVRTPGEYEKLVVTLADEWDQPGVARVEIQSEKTTRRLAKVFHAAADVPMGHGMDDLLADVQPQLEKLYAADPEMQQEWEPFIKQLTSKAEVQMAAAGRLDEENYRKQVLHQLGDGFDRLARGNQVGGPAIAVGGLVKAQAPQIDRMSRTNSYLGISLLILASAAIIALVIRRRRLNVNAEEGTSRKTEKVTEPGEQLAKLVVSRLLQLNESNRPL